MSFTTMAAPICSTGQSAQSRAPSRQQQVQPQQQCKATAPLHVQRRQLLAGLAAAAGALAARPAYATGLESIQLPTVEIPELVAQIKARNQEVLDSAEESFQNSDLLKTLKERSDANRVDRKKALEEKYCYRQAELGVGDCGGLRYIPGATKSGVQKRPEWLDNLFGLGGDKE